MSQNWMMMMMMMMMMDDATMSSSSDEDDFFFALQLSEVHDGSKLLDRYLACSAFKMDLLKSFPAVCS